MKILSNMVLGSAAALLAAGTGLAAEIPWSTFTGGGGIGQHGAVALGGALGPIAPALSPAAGGNYTLTGGFWPAFPGQPQPVLPRLKVKPSGGGKVRLSWAVHPTGFLLEYTTQLGSGIWLPEKTEVVKTAEECSVTVPAEDSRCYRLRSQ